MRAERLMSQPVVTCNRSDALSVAAHLMWTLDCGVVPVVDDDDVLVGIVTDRDVCMAAYTQGRPLQDIPLSTAMSQRVWSCGAGDSIGSVAKLMKKKQVRRVPVIDGNGRPLGIISLADIARHASRSRRKRSAGQEVLQTLAGICQPRSAYIEPPTPTVASEGSRAAV